MSLPENFKAYLSLIRQAKYKADQLIELIAPGHEMAEASLAIVWEAFFTHLCSLTSETPEEIDSSVLNTLASILQKLMSSFGQLRTLEAKICEGKEASLASKKAAEALRESNGIRKETLREIETRLNLL